MKLLEIGGNYFVCYHFIECGKSNIENELASIEKRFNISQICDEKAISSRKYLFEVK